MKCFETLQEMSLAIDRRLDAAGRRLLAQHLRGCGCCRHDYRSMKNAMSLAGRLRTHEVSPGFREDLLRRIEAGEGTPVGAIRELIPLAAKVRFGLLGAAAAALLLLTAGYFMPGGPIWGPKRVEVVTHYGPGPTPGTPVSGGLRPMTELADNAVNGTRQAVMGLQAAAHRFQTLPPEKGMFEVRECAVRVQERTRAIRFFAPWVGPEVIEEANRLNVMLQGLTDSPFDTPPAEFQRLLEPIFQVRVMFSSPGKSGQVFIMQTESKGQSKGR